MNRVYLGLGSNLASPHRQLINAILALRALPKTEFIAAASIIRSKAWGGLKAQPDYYNTVVLIQTTLTPLLLLEHCQHIEKKQGRIRKTHWGSRTLDIDILFYAERRLNTPKLTLPHPYIQHRDFVTLPLKELESIQSLPQSIPLCE